MRASRWTNDPFAPPEGEEIAEAEAQAGLVLVVLIVIAVAIAVSRMLA
jgi:hypothetical protein